MNENSGGFGLKRLAVGMLVFPLQQNCLVLCTPYGPIMASMLLIGSRKMGVAHYLSKRVTSLVLKTIDNRS